MILEELNGPTSLEVREEPDPSPGAGEVAIDVHAAGCNFFDVLITQGKYQVRPPLPFSPGAEISGVVREVGSGVGHLSVGDRVAALIDHGGYASSVVVSAQRVFPIPDEMTFDDAASMGIVYQTSHVALHRRANLQEGETLLVHAAAGGVGLAAVQIGVAAGARVIGTAGTQEKLDIILQHGATDAINYRTEDWVSQVKELTGGRGADVIYDPVGGDTFDLSAKCIAFEGRILVIGFASGRIPEMAMNRVLLKNISLVGVHWGLYTKMNPALLMQTQLDLYQLYLQGKVRPLVSKTYPLSEAATALGALADRRTSGKVVLRP